MRVTSKQAQGLQALLKEVAEFGEGAIVRTTLPGACTAFGAQWPLADTHARHAHLQPGPTWRCPHVHEDSPYLAPMSQKGSAAGRGGGDNVSGNHRHMLILNMRCLRSTGLNMVTPISEHASGAQKEARVDERQRERRSRRSVP